MNGIVLYNWVPEGLPWGCEAMNMTEPLTDSRTLIGGASNWTGSMLHLATDPSLRLEVQPRCSPEGFSLRRTMNWKRGEVISALLVEILPRQGGM